MTTERKPSERAVERWPISEPITPIQHASEEIVGQFSSNPVQPSKDRLAEIAAIISKHFPPTLETELAAMLEAIVGELACHRSEHSHAIMDARRLLTTYHQRRETTKE